jgi:hypothetical protein
VEFVDQVVALAVQVQVGTDVWTNEQVARSTLPQFASAPDPQELIFINARQGYEFDFLYTPGLALAGLAGLGGARE